MFAMRARRKLLLVALVGASLAVVTGALARPSARAAALIVRVAGVGGRLDRLAAFVNHAGVAETAPAIPTRRGPIRARVYRPESAPGRAVLIVPGINPSGVDEPRLVAFGRALAQAGLTAVTIEPTDLTRYRITADDTDRIEDAALWLSSRADLTGGRAAGLVGISFAGGLAVATSGRPTLKGRLAFVVSFGGYGDLPRVLRFLCVGELPDGSHARPHDYGLAVVLLNVLDRLVPADQVAPLREAVLTFMDASWLDLTDPEAARRTFDRARAQQAALAEPAATIMTWVNTRDVATAGPRLLPAALLVGSDPALSPERSAPPEAPVFLIHGVSDNVIPPQESLRLRDWLRPHTRVRLLVTPLITHAEVEPAWTLTDVWRLVSFWRAVMTE
jgi:dienelactone hydrolase